MFLFYKLSSPGTNRYTIEFFFWIKRILGGNVTIKLSLKVSCKNEKLQVAAKFLGRKFDAVLNGGKSGKKLDLEGTAFINTGAWIGFVDMHSFMDKL